MKDYLTRAAVREVDRIVIEECGMSGLVLMENAARGCTEIALSMLKADPGNRVSILCGKGNNGGDGFAIARHLDLAGVLVDVWAIAGEDGQTPDAAANFRLLEWSDVRVIVGESPPADLAASSLVIDAMLGTGATGDPRPPLDDWVDAANASGRPILSVDVPSGLDCDTGQPASICISATATATFVAEKVGFVSDAAKAVLGAIHVLDIGVPSRVLRRVFSGGD